MMQWCAIGCTVWCSCHFFFNFRFVFHLQNEVGMVLATRSLIYGKCIHYSCIFDLAFGLEQKDITTHTNAIQWRNGIACVLVCSTAHAYTLGLQKNRRQVKYICVFYRTPLFYWLIFFSVAVCLYANRVCCWLWAVENNNTSNNSGGNSSCSQSQFTTNFRNVRLRRPKITIIFPNI